MNFRESMLTLMERDRDDPQDREPESTDAGCDETQIPMSDPNLEESFLEDDNAVDLEEIEFDQAERDLDVKFYRLKRLSCFAHNLMLAVKTVSFCWISSPSSYFYSEI